MKLNYGLVRQWLIENMSLCSLDQLRELSDMVDQATVQAELRKSRIEEELAQLRMLAEDSAQRLGLPVEQILNLTRQGPEQRAGAVDLVVPVGAKKPRAGVRKPYMNPFQDDGTIYSISLAHPDRNRPEWLARAEAEGISLDQCHYKRLESTWRLKNMPRLYDPIARHAELVAQEPVKYQRLKRNPKAN